MKVGWVGDPGGGVDRPAATLTDMVLAELEVWHSRPDHPHPAGRARAPRASRRPRARLRRAAPRRRRRHPPPRGRRGAGPRHLPPRQRDRAGPAGGAAPPAPPLPGRPPRPGPQHPPADSGRARRSASTSRTTARRCSRSSAPSTPPSGWRRTPPRRSPACCTGRCAGTARSAPRSSPTWPAARGAGSSLVGLHRSGGLGARRPRLPARAPSVRQARRPRPVPRPADGRCTPTTAATRSRPARPSSISARPAASCSAEWIVLVALDGDGAAASARCCWRPAPAPAAAARRSSPSRRRWRPLPVERMDFPYRSAGRKAPDRPPVLLDAVRAEAAALVERAGVAPDRLALGGRSMGGRMCSMAVADGLPAAALVLVSYPLHPPGRPDHLRTAHLPRPRPCPACSSRAPGTPSARPTS